MASMKQLKQYVWWIVALVVIGGVIGGYMYYLNRPSDLDPLASGIASKGAKFYGAFWCPHCQAQKKIFDNAARLLPYVECSTRRQWYHSDL